MVQFFNPPASSTIGVREPGNPLAAAITIPAGIDRKASALREIIAANNPAFASLPEEQQFAISRNVVQGDPAVRASATQLRPSNFADVLDDKGNVVDQRALNNPFGSALQTNQNQPGLDDLPALSPATDASIGERFSDFAQTPIGRTLTLGQFAREDPSVSGSAIESPAANPSLSNAAQILNEIKVLKKSDPRLKNIKLDLKSLRKIAKEDGITVKEVIENLAEELGVKTGGFRGRGASGSF